MISLVGIGTAGENVVNCFTDNKEYDTYVLSDNVTRNTKYKRKIKYQEKLEDYESSIPDLTKFFSSINDHVQVFVCGSGRTANATLAILQYLRNKKKWIFITLSQILTYYSEPLSFKKEQFLAFYKSTLVQACLIHLLYLAIQH